VTKTQSRNRTHKQTNSDRSIKPQTEEADSRLQTAANLANDILVGESHNQPILRSIVFVAILNDETFSCVIIRLALCASDNIVHLADDSTNVAE